MKYMIGVEKKGSYMHVNEYGLILHYNRLLFQVCWSFEIEMQKLEVPFLFLKRKKIEIIFSCFMSKETCQKDVIWWQSCSLRASISIIVSGFL